MTAAVYTGFIVAVLVIARLLFVCRGLANTRCNTDSLTGLPNRQGFEAILADHLKHSRPLSVVCLNLDGFRKLNDLRGYAKGDAVLAQIGPRIRRFLRPGDSVGRFGGDQFLILLRGHDAVSGMMARILAAIDASAGVSLYPDHADSATKMLHLAETAMREAKAKARGRTLEYQPSMGANSPRGTEIATLIQSALTNHYFRLVYQPIVDVEGNIARMEAFVRIDDPVLGQVAPDEFIGVAEQTGLIHEVGGWVLRHACRQARDWRVAGFAVLVSIKMSPLQVASGALADGILGVIAESGLHPSAIAVEITGALRLTSPVERLRSAGIRISTQHWGERNSMFDDIRVRAPFNIPADRPAHLTVIAQGIEEPEQLDQAHAAGCDLFQGYQIAPPVEPKDAPEVLRTGLFARASDLVSG